MIRWLFISNIMTFSLGFNIVRVSKIPPLCPPSPLLLVFPKGTQIGLLLVDVLRTGIFTND